MNDMSPKTPKGSNKLPAGRGNYRISKKLGTALDLIATKGYNQTEAAKISGMDRSALNRALQRDPVAAELEARKLRYIEGIQATKGTIKALAYEVAQDLLLNSKSDSVKARMVEFLAGDGKQSGTSVTVNVGSPGYEYVRPGQRVVDITPGPADQASDGHITQAIEIADEYK